LSEAGRIHFIATPVGSADHGAAIEGLRDFLLENGVIRAEPVIVGQPAPEQRPGEVLDLIMLGATLVGSTAEVVGLIREWFADRRSHDVVSVKLEIGSQAVEIFGSPTYDDEERVNAFVRDQSGN
jgi:hypothetical protein